jgi:glycosyltransferase involved in cell wall biosynthesis
LTEETAAEEEIRVLYVTGGRRIGGMETHLVRLAGHLSSPVRCFVCCLDASADYGQRLTDAGIQHSNLNCPSLVHPRGMPAFLRFDRLVTRFQPHIVHSYGFVGDVVAGAVRARRSDIRLVTSRRGDDKNRRHQAVRRLVNRWSDKIVCVSAESAKFVQTTESPAPGLLEIIPNGVALHPAGGGFTRRGHPDGTIRIGTLGTVKPIKGTDLLVSAFMRFDGQYRVELVVAGLIDRPWAEALQHLAGVDKRIRFTGRCSDSDRFLADLDVFVLPSRSEGMSNSLLEAMALGLPCIATDVGSNRSLLNAVDEAPAGLVCDSNPDSLFRAMRTMVESTEARQRYGAQAATLVSRKYSIPTMVQRYDRLYRSVMGWDSTRVDVDPCGG